jgi:Zn-dependent peptidase ImmA (M78 family)
MAARFKAATKAAERLLTDAAVDAPPVDVEALAERLGIRIRREPFEGKLSGLLKRTENGAILGVNSSHPASRQRFTIAHEIGHFLLHTEALHVDDGFGIRFRDDTSSQATDDAEIEANQFASHLLMPASFLELDIRESGRIDIEDEDQVKVFADKYGVSTQAMTLRLAKFFQFGF